MINPYVNEERSVLTSVFCPAKGCMVREEAGRHCLKTKIGVGGGVGHLRNVLCVLPQKIKAPGANRHATKTDNHRPQKLSTATYNLLKHSEELSTIRTIIIS